MSKENDGGSAFPNLYHTASSPNWATKNGMSLRDWFAGQALAGWLATYSNEADHPTGDEASPAWATHIARASYRLADAMLAERGRS